MVTGSALFDTNILIDLFSGRSEAKLAIETWPPQNAISLITWMELMVGAKKYHQESRTRVALGAFNVIGVSQDMKREYQAGIWDEIAGCHHFGHCADSSSYTGYA